MLCIARVLGGIASVGISELIINLVKPSPKQPQPRVIIASQQTVPNNNPSDDITKNDIADTIQEDLTNLEKKEKECLLDVLGSMKLYFGDKIPEKLYELNNLTLNNGKKFVDELATRVRNNKTHQFGYALLWMEASCLLKEEMSRRVVNDMLQEEAQKLSIPLQPDDVPHATELLIQECTKQIDNVDIAREDKKNIKTFLSYVQGDTDANPNTDMVKEAYKNISKLVDMSKILQSADDKDAPRRVCS